MQLKEIDRKKRILFNRRRKIDKNKNIIHYNSMERERQVKKDRNLKKSIIINKKVYLEINKIKIPKKVIKDRNKWKR